MAKRQLSMVIDLHACVGCSACDIACKAENNVPDGFAWSNHMTETRGVFPDVKYRYIPTLCNHCSNAPCVTNCPTTAMHKTADGITMLDPVKCIGCRTCQLSCPFGVIYFNEEKPHQAFAADKDAAIPGCTATGEEVQNGTDTPLPYFNTSEVDSLPAIRPKGIVEKCTFCNHRLTRGENPACVDACPTGARIFGDLNQPDSAPRKALNKHDPKVLQPEKGTRPNVFYIRDF